MQGRIKPLNEFILAILFINKCLDMKYPSKFQYVLPICVACLIIAGCGKKPEDKAAEQAAKQIDKAVQVVKDYKANLGGYDYAKAMEEIAKAEQLAQKAGGQANQVYMLSGALADAQASKLSDSLEKITLEVNSVIASCGEKLASAASYATELESIKMLASTGKNEQQGLEKLLQDQSGLQDKIATNSLTLEKLESKIADYTAKINDLKSSIDNIKAESTKLLNNSDLQAGEARAKLEQKAFSIMSGTTGSKGQFDYEAELQGIKDKLEPIIAEKESLEKLIALMKNDATEVSKRIEALKNIDSSLGFTEQIGDLSGLIEQTTAALKDNTGKLNKVVEGFSAKVSEIESTYQQSIDAYSKVSKGLKEAAAVKIAEVRSSMVSLRSQEYAFFSIVNNSLESLSMLESDSMPAVVGEIKGNIATKVEEAHAKLNQAYDSAFEACQNAIDSSTSNSGKDTAARAFMALIFKKLQVAESENVEESLKQELLAKLDAIKDYSVTNDPQFGTSYIAGLFTKYGIEFKTAQQKLMERYEAAKMAFAQASNLSDTDRPDRLMFLIKEFNKLDKLENTEDYNKIVKYIFDLHKTDWIALSEDPAMVDDLELFSQMLVRTVEAEVVDGQVPVTDDMTGVGNIGGGEPNMP